jgi:hypothetical protein
MYPVRPGSFSKDTTSTALLPCAREHTGHKLENPLILPLCRLQLVMVTTKFIGFGFLLCNRTAGSRRRSGEPIVIIKSHRAGVFQGIVTGWNKNGIFLVMTAIHR